MIRSIWIIAVLVCSAAGCNSRPPELSRPHKLTPEVGRTALIELIRSGSSQELQKFPLEKYVDCPAVKASGIGWDWGPFVMEVDKKKYRYCQRLGGCSFEYDGIFEWRRGAWVASPPRCVSQALESKQ